MAYGPGDRPGGAKPAPAPKPKPIPRGRAPAAPSPVVKQAHQQRAQDLAKVGAAKAYIKKVAGAGPAPTPNKRTQPERRVGPVADFNAPRVARADRQRQAERGGKLDTTGVTVPHLAVYDALNRLYSDTRSVRDKAEAAHWLDLAGALPAKSRVEVKDEIPLGPGGGHSGRYTAILHTPNGMAIPGTSDFAGHWKPKETGLQRVEHLLHTVYSAPNAIGLSLPGAPAPGAKQAERLGIGGTTPPIGRSVEKSIESGALAGGGAVLTGLETGAAATRTAAAKGLVAAGAIRGNMAANIKRAPGPLKVLEHGPGKGVQGADITQGLGLGRKAGAVVDLTVDPAMWVGLGLAPETGGGSLALVGERLARIAPELRNDVRVAKIFTDHAAGSLTDKQGMRALRRLIKPSARPRDIKIPFTNRTILKGSPLKKALTAQNKKVVKGALADATRIPLQVSKRTLRSPFKKTLVTQDTVIAGHGAQAVQEALRHGEARLIKPQARFKIMTPLGHDTGIGVNLPGGRILEHTPIALKVSRAAQDLARQTVRTRMAGELDQHLRELDKRIEHLSKVVKAPPAEVHAVRVQRAELERAWGIKTKQAEDLAVAEVGRRTVGDAVAARNSQKQITHQAVLAGQDFGRTTSAKYSQAVEHAVSPVRVGKGRAKSLERVQMYLNTWADTKGVGLAHLAEAIGPMTKDEQTAFLNLRRLYRRQGAHELKSGVLQHALHDYVGQRSWEEQTGVLSAHATRGSTSTFQHHRTVAAIADYAEPAALARALQSVSNKPMDDAAALGHADRLWSHGHLRSMTELLRGRLLREGPIPWDSLTHTEQAAARRLSTTGLVPDRPIPMVFTPETHPEMTHGMVMLNPSPEAQRVYNTARPALDHLHPEDQIKAHVLSATADRQRVAEMLNNAAGPLKHDLGQIHQRLGDEIRAHELLPAMEHGQQAANEGTKRLNEALSLPAEEKALQAERQALSAQQVGQAAAGGHFGTPEDVAVAAKEISLHHRTKAFNEAVASNPLAGAPAHVLAAEGKRLSELRQQVSSIQEAVASGEPKALRALVPGVYSVQADQHGELWIRGIHNGDQPPIEGMVIRPGEYGPHEDPFNYFGSLPDFRGQTTKGNMVELDPRKTGYARARAGGLSAAWQSRWQGFDRQYGRSARAESAAMYRVKATGERGQLDRLYATRDEKGDITGYKQSGVENPRSWAPHELEIRPGTLVHDVNGETWINTATGVTYEHVRNVFESGLMLHNISEDRVWPRQAIEQLKIDSRRIGEGESVGKGSASDALYQDLSTSVAQKVMGITRFSVTSPFPAYHIRNMASDLIKSLQADTGVLFHPIVNFKAMTAAVGRGRNWNIRVPGYGKMKMEDFLFVAEMFGVKSGHHVAEVAALLRKGDFSNTRIEHALRHGSASWFTPGGLSTKAGAKREDIVRYMTFMQRMRSNGGDAADASWYTIKHHFNFNDLTGMERKYVRNAFLFYTWYRKNIPLQLVELVRRPSFFAGMSHTYNAIAAGHTPLNVGPFSGAAPAQPYLPDYVHDKLQAATVNWNQHALNIAFGAPYADLSFASYHGLADMLTLTNPYAQALAQTAGGDTNPLYRHDLLVGRRYKTNEAGGAANILNPIYKYLTGKDLPIDETGQPTLPWALNVWLRQFPIFGRASAAVATPGAARDPGRLQKYANLTAPLTGMNIYVSPKPGTPAGVSALHKFGVGIAQGRRQAQEDVSNFPTKGKFYLGHVNAQDKKTLQILKERGLTKKALEDIKSSGYYKSHARHSSSGTFDTGGGSSFDHALK